MKEILILCKEMFRLLNKNERIELYKIQFLVTFMTLGEMIGIASVIPFMIAISDSSQIQSNMLLSTLYNFLGLTESDFLVALGLIILVIIFLSSINSVWTSWKLYQFSTHIGMAFSSDLFRYYLNREWLFHTKNSSDKLTSKLLLESRRMTDAIISPLIQLFAKLFFISSVFIGLLIINPVITFFGITLFIISYMIVFKFASIQLRKNDESLTEHSVKRTTILTESLSGIKDIIFMHNQDYFTKAFENSNKKFAMSQALNSIISIAPKYFIEFVIFSSIITLILFLLNFNSASITTIVPILAIFALVAIKIIPSFQVIYGSLSKIKGNISSFHILREDLLSARDYKKAIIKDKDDNFTFSKFIELKNLSFSYPGEREKVLNQITMKINKGETIGFAGLSGSGKSTIIDLILGFIDPDEGEISIDGANIKEISMKSFRKKIGFVRQDIFLVNGSIKDNITFGNERKETDEALIKKAIEVSSLNDFIEKIPQGINTMVGERGVQLSGGQKQRIAIARAIYGNEKEILVFDEGTSALDGSTEKKVINRINEMPNKPTIIMIAHRLTTLKKCDKIYLINNGSVLNQGSYNYLLKNDKIFQKMEQEIY
jgi:HlyD family secretion protein